MLDFDEIRKEVAIRHNVLLGKDDPILAAVTVNELVLGRYLDLISDQYDEANRTLTLTLQQQVEQSKETAGKIITEAANYVSDQMRQTVAEAVKEAGKDLRRQVAEVQAASRDAVASGRDAQVAKNSAVVAAVLSGVAALVAVVALMVVLLK
ncbi:conjugal transfer protein TraM [Salmonella enterica]|nr:conjugal transfer protein TraM [Salmonella enterica]